MPHIKLPENVPGILGPMLAYPETNSVRCMARAKPSS